VHACESFGIGQREGICPLGKVFGDEDQNITQTIFGDRKTGHNIHSDDVHGGTGNYLAKPALMSGQWTFCLCTDLTLPIPQLNITVHVRPIVQGSQLVDCSLWAKISSKWSCVGEFE